MYRKIHVYGQRFSFKRGIKNISFLLFTQPDFGVNLFFQLLVFLFLLMTEIHFFVSLIKSWCSNIRISLFKFYFNSAAKTRNISSVYCANKMIIGPINLCCYKIILKTYYFLLWNWNSKGLTFLKYSLQMF